jgi:hypothetical protein
LWITLVIQIAAILLFESKINLKQKGGENVKYNISPNLYWGQARRPNKTLLIRD